MDRLETYYKNSLLSNLCKEYKGMWQKLNKDKEGLVKMSLCQQAIPHVVTFAYEGKGLTKEFLLAEFADQINGVTHHDCDEVKGYDYSLYVGYTDEISGSVDVCSMMWCDIPQYVVKARKCPILYISNKSKVNLVCEGYSYVRVYLFDESELTVEDTDENTDIIVYKYSEKCSVNEGQFCLGRVNEFEKQLRL